MINDQLVVWSLSSVQLFCNPMEFSPLGSSVCGISQARILEWVASSFSRGSPWPKDQTRISCIAANSLLSETPGKPKSILWRCVIHSVVSNSLWPHGLLPTQAPLSMAFSRQEYWSGLPFPSPRYLPEPGIKPASPSLAGRFFTTDLLGKPSLLNA